MHQLLAIVSVAHEHRIQCRQPGCGHSVYAAIYVVSETDGLLVLGGTCFGLRYGAPDALGGPKFGSINGRRLTEEERQMLVENTEALMALFEEQHRRALALAAPPSPPPAPAELAPALSATAQGGHRKTWQKPLSSITYYSLTDGRGWLRVQHTDGQHLLLPWPALPGWDAAVPAEIGMRHESIQGLLVPNLPAAVRWMSDRLVWVSTPGRWADVQREIHQHRTAQEQHAPWRVIKK